jgi:Fe2+ transport system protein FeoA
LTLTDSKNGQWLKITHTEGDDILWQALRFGIGQGSIVQVQKNIPGGPVIISRNQLEIAVGRQLACRIQVAPSDNDILKHQ